MNVSLQTLTDPDGNLKARPSHWGVTAAVFMRAGCRQHAYPELGMAASAQRKLNKVRPTTCFTASGLAAVIKVVVCHPAGPFGYPMEAFLNSSLIVALGEIGDKTNILALMLAVRYKTTTPIIAGILFATFANHLLAALVGVYLSHLALVAYLPWILSLSFIVLGLWVLIPDKAEDEAAPKKDYGAFLTTIVAFFLAEMGDKTQIAIIALAAKYQDIAMVIAGSTTGLMIANVPVIFFGEKLLSRIPMTWVHRGAALIFIGFGIAGLISLRK